MVESKNIKDFFKLLNEEKLTYVLIKNDENRLPYKLDDGDDVDILIHPEDYSLYLNFLKKNGYELLHSEADKYYFLYNMRSDIYAKKDDLFTHAYDKLSCCSFTNMGLSKIPLDRKIQNHIWENKKWDEENKWWIMDDKSILLYLITRSIFDKKVFKKRYIHEIEKRRALLQDKDFLALASLVFFNFTKELVILLQAKKYDEIHKKYKNFKNY